MAKLSDSPVTPDQLTTLGNMHRQLSEPKQPNMARHLTDEMPATFSSAHVSDEENENERTVIIGSRHYDYIIEETRDVSR